MDVLLYARTNGQGQWSSQKKEVLVSRIMVDGPIEDDAVFLRAAFDRKTWSTRKDGLVYTDPRWIKEFRAGLVDLGLSKAVAARVDYTEHGLQGRNDVSLVFRGGDRDMAEFLKFMGARHPLAWVH